jgi:3-hydroxymyristoyl/3-hydroxydecanoyl-(acyl carrier protein) dehydratase
LKKVKTEIEQSMSRLEASGSSVTSWFLFTGDFVGFQGHFPGKKILPGVCQVQCALSTLERAKQKPLELREIVIAKYFSPVSPEEEIQCLCSDVAEAGEFTFKTMITKGNTKVAELKLRVAYKNR